MMDFHVWAKLDSDGRIQSVQSSCTQSPQEGQCPMWTSPVPVERPGGAPQLNTEGPERLVPYMDKKALVYKLDAKVDEMSVIMTQLAELSKRVKVQEKLIYQYEEKFKQKEKQLKALVIENMQLKAEKQSLRKNKSCSFSENALTHSNNLEPANVGIKMVCSLENSGKAHSWPCERQFHHGHIEHANTISHTPTECSAKTVAFDDVDSGGFGLPCKETDVKGIVRPSSLNFGFDIYGNFPGGDVGVEGHFNIRHKDSTSNDIYSYARRPDQSFLQPAKDLLIEAKKIVDNSENLDENNKDNHIDNVKVDVSKDHSVFHLDSDNYLDMNACAIHIGDSAYSLEKPVDERELGGDIDKPFECGPKEYIANEAIHSTWKDVQTGNIITTPVEKNTGTQTHVMPDGYLEPVGGHSEYMELEVPAEDSREEILLPTRLPKPDNDRENKCGSTSSAPTEQYDTEPVYGATDRRTSLPVLSSTCAYGYTAVNKDGRSTKLAKTRQVHSYEHPDERKLSLQSHSDKRSPTLEMRKDDHLNKVLKDMRTTMEWNKAKKKLISKSNANTVDNVEHRLRSTVQEVYDAYCILQAEKGTRLRKYAKEKVMEKIKSKLKRSPVDMKASDEFMRKCLDLVMSTCSC